MKILYWLLFKIWLLFGIYVLRWTYISIYSPDKENVTAMTFSQDEKYIDKVEKVE